MLIVKEVMESRPQMYRWRNLTHEQREELLGWRKFCSYPWHRPPHPVAGRGSYHLTAACFEHASFIGTSIQRLAHFSESFVEVLMQTSTTLHAWCVLPNHYHALVSVPSLDVCLTALGRLHGRTAHAWNGEDVARGRKVWSPVADRSVRSNDHFWEVMNYVHHNPVRHGYVSQWQDWPFSSAHACIESMGREEADACGWLILLAPLVMGGTSLRCKKEQA